MLFITSRKFDSNGAFDLSDTSSSNHIRCCSRSAPSAYEEVGSLAMLQELKDSKAKEILIYIHGYSNLPEDHIFPRAAKLQELFGDLVQVVPLIWPCDNDLSVACDYWDDQRAADQSAYAFARMLQKLVAWQSTSDAPCMKRINILAHSMGNRVLRETLKNAYKYTFTKGVPSLFGSIFMVAADVVNDTLENDGRHIADAVQHKVIVYYASDDFALRSSKVVNVRNAIAAKRLGHTGPRGEVPPNVISVDCDSVNNVYDFTGHSYFLDHKGAPGVVFQHIYDAIENKRFNSYLKK